ncbi:protein of unknown function [Hyphomicrobium sp. 1Nfss2.1]
MSPADAAVNRFVAAVRQEAYKRHN